MSNANYQTFYKAPVTSILAAQNLTGARMIVYLHYTQWGRLSISTDDLEATYGVKPTSWRKARGRLVAEGWLERKAKDALGNELVVNPLMPNLWMYPDGGKAHVEAWWYEATIPEAIKKAVRPKLANLDRWSRMFGKDHRWVIYEDKAQVQVNDHLEAVLEDIPKVFPWMTYKDTPSIKDRWPSLFEWDNPDIVELWANKVPRTVSVKGHPMMEVKDRDVRVQVALILLSEGVKAWPGVDDVRDPVAFLLSALKTRVGRERGYTNPKLDVLAKGVEEAMKSFEKKEQLNLQDMAWNHLAGENDEDAQESEEDLVEHDPRTEVAEAASGACEPPETAVLDEHPEHDPWAAMMEEMYG